jgi:hypothetical protein
MAHNISRELLLLSPVVTGSKVGQGGALRLHGAVGK